MFARLIRYSLFAVCFAPVLSANSALAQSYCPVSATSANYEWIKSVTFGTFANLNNDGATRTGYQNFTNLTVPFNKGAATAISLVPGFSGGAYGEVWRIWVDLNGDGDFADSGE